MNILHVSNKPIYPELDGGCVAMRSLLEDLSSIGEVNHACLSTSKHPFLTSNYPENRFFQLISNESWKIDTSIRPFRAFWNLITGKNYNLSRFYSSNISEKLKIVLSKNNYDLIVLESVFLASYIPVIRALSEAKIVVRTHNVEFELWEQQAVQTSSFIKKWYLNHLSKTLKREEIILLNTADQLWTIAEEDGNRFKELNCSIPIIHIPVSITIPEEKSDYTTASIYHLGSLNWFPNQQAVSFLIEKVHPHLKTPELHIAGSFSKDFVVNSSENIHFHGFVQNSTKFMATHGILVTPIFSGSGIRIKLLEAMSIGVPCITTQLGASGINLTDSPLCIAETAQEWVAQITELLNSQKAREKLGKLAKAYIEKYHSATYVQQTIQKALGNA